LKKRKRKPLLFQKNEVVVKSRANENAPHSPTPTTTTTNNSGIEGGKMSATVVDAFVAQLQRDAARGAVGAPVGGGGASGLFGAGGAGAGTSHASPAAAAAVPASKWAARSWEELPDNFAGSAPSNKDQQWPRPPSSSQQQQQQPASPLAAAGPSPGLVAAAMTPGGPSTAARGGGDGSTPSPLPQTAFKQRANAGQVVSALNAEGDEGLPELGAAAAASRRRYQRLLRERKAARQQKQGDEQQQQDEGAEEHTAAAATAVVLSAPNGDAQASSSSFLLASRGHRYMMERVEDKVAALDARISAFERALRAALRSTGGRADLAGSELAAVGAPYIDDGDAEGGGLFVGRVVSEAAAAGGAGSSAAATAAPPPLNAASLLLEGGVASSDGGRARLVLTPAATANAPVRLFPGQVVGVRGFSPAGHTIFARQVYTHVPVVGGGGCGGGGGGGKAATGPAAAKEEAEAEAAAAAAAPMDLDAIVAAAGGGDESKEQEDEQQQQAKAATAAKEEEEAEQRRRLAAAKKALDSSPPALSIVAAAGPFTCSDDLSYDPLTALLEALRPNPPDLLLLLGPFVDAEHPRVSDGLCPCPLDALLSEGVAGRLASWRASLPQPHRSAMRVALVPSVRDAPAHPTFPQPPLELPGAVGLVAAGAGRGSAPSSSSSARQQQQQQQQQQQAPDALVALQNPCTFVVTPSGEAAASSSSGNSAPSSSSSSSVVVAATSQDVLRHLAGSELAVGSGSVDRLSALASHLLGQRHIYPLFPAHASACLDTSRDALLRLPPGGGGNGGASRPHHRQPDLLLLPSDLAPFARRVPPTGPGGCGGVRPGAPPPQDDVLCVNPGRLAKGAGGGTYARIVVVGGGGGGGAGAADASSLPLADRARVEIVRV
jgi:DNA polymerase alpha subunit B